MSVLGTKWLGAHGSCQRALVYGFIIPSVPNLSHAMDSEKTIKLHRHHSHVKTHVNANLGCVHTWTSSCATCTRSIAVQRTQSVLSMKLVV